MMMINWPYSIEFPPIHFLIRVILVPPHHKFHVLFLLVRHSQNPKTHRSSLVCSNLNHHVPASSVICPFWCAVWQCVAICTVFGIRWSALFVALRRVFLPIVRFVPLPLQIHIHQFQTGGWKIYSNMFWAICSVDVRACAIFFFAACTSTLC